MARLRPLTHADRAPDTMHVASMSAGPTDPVAAKDYLGAPEYHPAFARYLQECLDDEQAVSWPTSDRWWARSEEHTSELQSHSDLVCRLLLEKKTKAPHDRVSGYNPA